MWHQAAYHSADHRENMNGAMQALSNRVSMNLDARNQMLMKNYPQAETRDLREGKVKKRTWKDSLYPGKRRCKAKETAGVPSCWNIKPTQPNLKVAMGGERRWENVPQLSRKSEEGGEVGQACRESSSLWEVLVPKVIWEQNHAIALALDAARSFCTCTSDPW